MSYYKTILQGEHLRCMALDDCFSFSEIIPRDDSYFWGRKDNKVFKNSVDLSDIFNFYRVYDIENVASLFSDKNISLYVDSKTRIKNTLKSYNNIIKNKNNFSIEELVPENLLKEYCHLHIELLKSSHKFLKDTSNNYDDIIKFFKGFTAANCIKKLNYNIKTTSGIQHIDLLYQANFRMKSRQGCFNFFNMQKKDRSCIIPQDSNSYIFCADFRQFEIRTLCLLNSTIDIDFSNKEIYSDLANKLGMNKDDAKVQIIAYGYGQKNDKLDKVLNRKAILDKINNNFFSWRGYPVIVGNKDAESVKIHTVVQTISQYIYIEKLSRILSLLDNKKSKFLFPLHDSIVVSINKEEQGLKQSIVDIMEDDVYKVRQYEGTNFFNLKEID